MIFGDTPAKLRWSLWTQEMQSSRGWQFNELKTAQIRWQMTVDTPSSDIWHLPGLYRQLPSPKTFGIRQPLDIGNSKSSTWFSPASMTITAVLDTLKDIWCLTSITTFGNYMFTPSASVATHGLRGDWSDKIIS